MSKTRKRLEQLFRPPSTDVAGGFDARSLDRAPKEFDAQGSEIIHRPAAIEAPATARSKTPWEERTTPAPPRSKAPWEGLAPPNSGHNPGRGPHTGPSAAQNAFSSWAKSRQQEPASESRPATIQQRQRVLEPGPSTFENQAPESRPTALTPPAEDDREQRLAHARSLSPQQSFDAWKARKAASETAPAAPSDNAHERTRERGHANDAPAKLLTSPRIETPEERPFHRPAAGLSNRENVAESTSPASPQSDVDRVIARARMAQDFARIRQRHEQKPTMPEPPVVGEDPVDGAEAQDFVLREGIPFEAPAKKSKQRERHVAPLVIPTTAQSASERILWVYAHRAQLQASEILSLLSEVDARTLRAALRARRHGMLAQALMQLGNAEAAVEHLLERNRILPHDTWAMWLLAEHYARIPSALEEALHWCEKVLQQAPWLSSAQELHDRLNAALQKMH